MRPRRRPRPSTAPRPTPPPTTLINAINPTTSALTRSHHPREQRGGVAWGFRASDGVRRLAARVWCPACGRARCAAALPSPVLRSSQGFERAATSVARPLSRGGRRAAAAHPPGRCRPERRPAAYLQDTHTTGGSAALFPSCLSR